VSDEITPIGLADLLDALVRRHIVEGAKLDEELARRGKLLRVCDLCHEDYYDLEHACIRALHPAEWAGLTVCRDCVEAHGFTGCTFVLGRGYELDLFGTHEPPEAWDYEAPAWAELRTGLVCSPTSWTARLAGLR
jgi:hypothetical protein